MCLLFMNKGTPWSCDLSSCKRFMTRVLAGGARLSGAVAMAARGLVVLATAADATIVGVRIRSGRRGDALLAAPPWIGRQAGRLAVCLLLLCLLCNVSLLSLQENPNMINAFWTMVAQAREVSASEDSKQLLSF
mmetsp:Transcript_154297/g.273667  ORF Transcript_154297/g.273667 Transcript_154297/m.273667 type:complete len:134 (+) Transcript_154297:25-426(+)